MVSSFPSAPARRTVLQASGGATAFSPLAPGPALEQGKPSLTVLIGADLVPVDPHKLIAGLDHSFFGNVFESLFANDVEGNLVPALAVSANVSADGLVHDFLTPPRLRDVTSKPLGYVKPPILWYASRRHRHHVVRATSGTELA